MGGGHELRIELGVPDITALLPDLAGRVDAQLTLAGEVDAIRIVGSVTASELRFPGDHRVARASATFRGGMGNEGINGFDTNRVGAAQHSRQRVFYRKHQTSPTRVEMNSAILAGAFRSSTGSGASIV